MPTKQIDMHIHHRCSSSRRNVDACPRAFYMLVISIFRQQDIHMDNGTGSSRRNVDRCRPQQINTHSHHQSPGQQNPCGTSDALSQRSCCSSIMMRRRLQQVHGDRYKGFFGVGAFFSPPARDVDGDTSDRSSIQDGGVTDANSTCFPSRSKTTASAKFHL